MSIESSKQDDLRLEQQRAADKAYAELSGPKADELNEADKQRTEQDDRQHPLSGEQALDHVAKERYEQAERSREGDAPSLGGMNDDDNNKRKEIDLSKEEYKQAEREIAETEREKEALEIKKQDEEAQARAEELLKKYS